MKRMSKILILGSGILLISLLPVRAEEIHVPANSLNIQGAINAAEEGDEIIVAPGTYCENINFLGKSIIVKSTDPNDPDTVASTIIDGTGAGRVATFRNEEENDSVLSGFTLQNGNALTGNYGGGIYCYKTSPTISNCNICGSTAQWGGGMCCYLSSALIINCTLSNNSANFNGGGIICQSSSPIIRNCIISNNSVFYDGGGIYCYYNSSPNISNCIIKNNSANQEGGGISCNDNSSPAISLCIISNNSVTTNGGGIACRLDSSATISNCIINHNSAQNNGGGISCYENSSPVINNCNIIGNLAGSGGGMYYYYSSPGITNCIFWNDSPDEICGTGSPAITYSDIQGDYPGENNINIDPLFVDPGEEDYYLQPNSPCIDAGINEFTASEDMNGITRPRDGDDDGSSISDIGVYEYILPNEPVDLSRQNRNNRWPSLYSQLNLDLFLPDFSFHEPFFYRVFPDYFQEILLPQPQWIFNNLSYCNLSWHLYEPSLPIGTSLFQIRQEQIYSFQQSNWFTLPNLTPFSLDSPPYQTYTWPTWDETWIKNWKNLSGNFMNKINTKFPLKLIW